MPDCHASRSRYGAVWRRHFYEGLTAAGVELTIPEGIDYDWARPAQIAMLRDNPEQEATSRRLGEQIDRAMAAGIDAVISYCFSHDLQPDLVERVRAAGVPWINFFCDSTYAFHTVENLARHTSLNWFVESAAEGHYRALDVPYLHAPYALNPLALPDLSCRESERAVTFIGVANRPRIRTLALLRLAGVDVHVRGTGWQGWLQRNTDDGAAKAALRLALRATMRDRVGEHLSEDGFREFVRGSSVLLGLSQGGTGNGPYTSYLKLRDLEFPGFGCCYLAEHSDDIGRVFDTDTEVRSFSSVREARATVRELLSDPAECWQMGQRARQRVLDEHTWSARLPQLADALG